MAEYSYTQIQNVADTGNILFTDGERACKKGFIFHRSDSGIFKLRGCANRKAIYKVTFNGNIAIATGGTVGAISVALQEDGETIGNAISTVTPAATGEYFNVSFSTFIYVTCGCCATIAVENISGTAIDVQNANIIFERVA